MNARTFTNEIKLPTEQKPFTFRQKGSGFERNPVGAQTRSSEPRQAHPQRNRRRRHGLPRPTPSRSARQSSLGVCASDKCLVCSRYFTHTVSPASGVSSATPGRTPAAPLHARPRQPGRPRAAAVRDSPRRRS